MNTFNPSVYPYYVNQLKLLNDLQENNINIYTRSVYSYYEELYTVNDSKCKQTIDAIKAESKGKIVVMPDSLEKIQGDLFQDSAGVILNEGLTQVEDAFQDMTEVILPSNLISAKNSFNNVQTFGFNNYSKSEILNDKELLFNLLGDLVYIYTYHGPKKINCNANYDEMLELCKDLVVFGKRDENNMINVPVYASSDIKCINLYENYNYVYSIDKWYNIPVGPLKLDINKLKDSEYLIRECNSIFSEAIYKLIQEPISLLEKQDEEKKNSH